MMAGARLAGSLASAGARNQSDCEASENVFHARLQKYHEDKALRGCSVVSFHSRGEPEGQTELPTRAGSDLRPHNLHVTHWVLGCRMGLHEWTRNALEDRVETRGQAVRALYERAHEWAAARALDAAKEGPIELAQDQGVVAGRPLQDR